MAFGLALLSNFVLTGNAPSAPADLAGNAVSQSQIDGTYTPSATAGATHTLSHSHNGGSTWTDVTVTGGTYSLTGLTGFQIYQIRLIASNVWGSSAYVGPISVFTQGTPPVYPALQFNDARNSMYAGVI